MDGERQINDKSAFSLSETEGVPRGQEPHYQTAGQAWPYPEDPGRE